MRKIKYITSILLLIILPLSAIGFHVATHVCKHHSNTSSLATFFGQSPGCCCESNSTDEANCSEETHSNQTGQTDITDESGQAPSCCQQEMEDAVTDSSNKYSDESSSGIKLIDENCCVNSSEFFSLNIETISQEVKIAYPISAFLFVDFIHSEIILKNNCDEILQNLKYPLKEPIFSIIDYIHSSSSAGLSADSIA